MGARETHDALLRELNAERASALVRIANALEALLEQLAASRARLAMLSGDERRSELVRYGQVRQRALEYRWYLDVQREALGLRPHESVDRFYGVPAPIDA